MAGVVTYRPDKQTVVFYEKNYKSLHKGVTEAVENFPVARELVLMDLYEKFSKDEIKQIAEIKATATFSARESSLVDVQAQIIGGEIGSKIKKLTPIECFFLMEFAINSSDKGLAVNNFHKKS